MACAMCCSITVLPAFGRRHDQAALALADRRDDVDDAAGDVLLGLDVALELERLVGVQRRQVLEQDLVLGVLGRLAVDLVDLDQREVALAVLRRADLAFDGVAGVQVEAADLRRARRRCRRCRRGSEVSGERRKPKPSGSTSSVPSPKMLSPFFAWFFSSAKIRSCLRMRLAPSISFVLAMSRSSVTCLVLSSESCMGVGDVRKGRRAARSPRRGLWDRGARKKIAAPLCGAAGPPLVDRGAAQARKSA